MLQTGNLRAYSYSTTIHVGWWQDSGRDLHCIIWLPAVKPRTASVHGMPTPFCSFCIECSSEQTIWRSPRVTCDLKARFSSFPKSISAFSVKGNWIVAKECLCLLRLAAFAAERHHCTHYGIDLIYNARLKVVNLSLCFLRRTRPVVSAKPDLQLS